MSRDDDRWELVRRYVEGVATANETRTLEAAVRDDAAFRLEFLRYLNVDAALGGGVASGRFETTESSIIASRQDEHCTVDAATSAHPVLVGRGVIQRRSRAFATVAAMLVLCVIGFVALWLRRDSAIDSPELGVALLSSAVDLEWAEETETRSIGAVLESGSLRLKSGAALVEFYSGSRVVVEGPAEFQLVSANEGYLHSGRIRAHVPPLARGFTVRTAQFDVVDRGTEFGVAVDRDAGTATSEVHVFNGLVEVQRDSVTREVKTGVALRCDRNELSELACDQTAFLREEELQERAAIAEQTRFAEWDAARRRLSADPTTVLHEPLTTRTIEQGSVVGCDWTAGRWPQKSALLFRRSADRVRFEVEDSLQQVTLLSWVKVDAVAPGMTVLMAVEHERVGSLNWLITQRGQLRLEVGRDLGHRQLDWEAINSESIVTRERFGEWLLLATTFDGLRIRHFLNGQPCGSGASFRPPSLQIGIAELGNGPAPAMKHLFGAIDEFAIVGRAMTEAELRDYFEKGRP